MKKIELKIECPSCNGTGLYKGMGEGEGAAVICYKCNGTGCYSYSYSYNDFTDKKPIIGIGRVYLSGYGYRLGLGKINFSNGIGEIDMDKEGISYQEFFIEDKRPAHIKRLACPMLADQSACHKIPGFIDRCNDLNGSWINFITGCKHYPLKHQCWKRFESAALNSQSGDIKKGAI